MKILLTALAITALSTTLAFAQAAATTTDTTGATGATMSKDNCTAMMAKVHPNADTAWTDVESKPYLDKMTAMKLSPKTEGKLTSDDFMTACQAGAFPAVN